MQASARARSNIALVKYWGKADSSLNIPAVGSISVTLDRLWSETEVRFDPALRTDRFILDGRRRREEEVRVVACLDLLRRRAGVSAGADVVSRNNFPTGAGLASSASGFAALAAAAARALGLDLTPRELSIVARRGSGSAARSIFGGFVEMHAGGAADGEDSYAEPLLEPRAWPLAVLIAVTDRCEKAVGSRAGMELSAASSPYYRAWIESSAEDLEAARIAIRRRDFEQLAEVAEHSCLKMHAAAMSSRPGLVYWNAATLACLHAVRAARSGGLAVFFTIDAGPQLKAVCEPAAQEQVERILRAVPGVEEVLATGLGPGVEVT
jgi:diphosphomevalonate decarboxylase